MAMKLNGVNFSLEKGWEFSIEKICELIDGVIPPEIDKTLVLHNMYLNYIGNQSYQKERTILFYGKSSPTKMEKVVELMEKWNLIVVSERSIVNAEGKILPTIRVKDAVEAWCAIGAYLKMSHPVPTIGITGSVGKTTTTKFAECVFNEKYKVFISGMNRNVASLAVRRMLKEYGSPYTFHVQETGGGDIKRVETMASFLNCDAFGITGIEANHHLDKYITTENMVADKTSFDRYGKEEQFCVLNGDDELLMQQTYRSKVYTYGIRNKNVDYVGTNIAQNGKYLEFDVDDHETLTHIKIQIPGVHNVYNALMVFIFAKKFGLTDKQIQNGFLNYSSSGIRQNIKEIAGRTLYIDCFNVCSASILSCCDTLEQIRVEEGKKRIAVIGGENALGDISFDANFETGKLLQKYQNIDRFVFVGLNRNRSKADLDYYGNGAAVYEGAKAAGMETEYSFCDDLNALADILRNETEPGDVVLFKGLFRWPIFAAIDMAFGTSFLARNVNFKPKKANAIAIECEYYTEIGGAVLKKYDTSEEVVTIPGTFDGKHIVRIGRNVFRGKAIKEVVIPDSVKSIGSCAFLESSLEKITFPNGFINIEYGAFARCSSLKCINLEHAETIGKRAFRGCKNLETIILSERCMTIEESAFEGCEKAVFYAPEGTKVYDYLKSNGLNVVSAEK